MTLAGVDVVQAARARIRYHEGEIAALNVFLRMAEELATTGDPLEQRLHDLNDAAAETEAPLTRPSEQPVSPPPPPPAAVERTPPTATSPRPMSSPKPSPTPREPLLIDRVLALHEQNPELSKADIARILGVPSSSVQNALRRRGVNIPNKPRWGRVIKPAPAEPANQPPAVDEEDAKSEDSEERDEPDAADEPDLLPNPLPRRRPATAASGTRFRLLTADGEQYLHMSGQGLTRDRQYAWSGNADHLLAVRRKFPAARDLHEEVVL